MYYVCLEVVLRVVRVASLTDIDTNVYVCLEVVLREVRVVSVPVSK